MSLERIVACVEWFSSKAAALGREPARSVAYVTAPGHNFLVSVVINDRSVARFEGRSLREAEDAALHAFESWAALALQELREEKEADRGIANLAEAAAKLGIGHRDVKPSNVIQLRGVR